MSSQPDDLDATAREYMSRLWADDDEWDQWREASHEQHAQNWMFRNSGCDGATDVSDQFGETQMVYPVEHGVGCKGHRRYVSGIRDLTTYPVTWQPDYAASPHGNVRVTTIRPTGGYL